MAKKAPRRAIAIGSTAMSTTRTVEQIPIGFGFKASINGLIVEGNPEIAQWDAIGKYLRVMERGAQFAIGDFLRQCEDRFGEEASQIIDESEWSRKTCEQYRRLAQDIAIEDRRMDRLGIQHHQLVAHLPKAKQVEWLTKAADDENEVPWTAARLRQAMRAGEDLKPTGWWVLVSCDNEKAQRKFMDQMEKQGRVCKAVVRRERVARKRRARKAVA